MVILEKMMSNVDFFKENKYCVVKKALSLDAAEIAGTALVISEIQGVLDVDTKQVVGATCTYRNPTMESILLKMHKTVEENTGLGLIPTYSFARIYRNGDSLERHKDRPSCEISATITLTFDSEKIWPIFVDSNGEKEISLDKGDLMIYRGCDVEHWRDKFCGDLWMQVFIHYVDKNGPYPDFAWDKNTDWVPGTYPYFLDKTIT